MSEREHLSYTEFGSAVIDLAHQIRNSQFQPEIVLSIARGGFFLGAALGYALGVKNSFTMSVEFYTGIEERLPMPVVLPPVPNKVDLKGATVLIADDVADSGETLRLVQDFWRGTVKEARTVVLYEKPRSVVKPDYVWRKTEKWIEFPWSAGMPL
ncbi:MAG: phosphoribosyltransferase [Candidatus Nanopelagicaceae bacterium]|jgi:hypoxanthine phosphoribosyltransferase